MHGNLWEWCLDDWHDSYEGAQTDPKACLTNNDNHSQVLRGVSWYENPEHCRPAYRYDFTANNHFGFRLVRDVARRT